MQRDPQREKAQQGMTLKVPLSYAYLWSLTARLSSPLGTGNMSRAAVTYKTKEELNSLTLREIDAYISWLRQRACYLGGPARKLVEKRAAVAEKVRDLIFTQEGGR
jgi:hypothetical protein